jgi:hypothetical protein
VGVPPRAIQRSEIQPAHMVATAIAKYAIELTRTILVIG